MKRPIAILGAGNAATALAILLARRDRPIHLYSIEDDVTREINAKHRNSKYLKGIALPKQIRAFGNVAEAVHRADVVFVAVPSFALEEAVTLALPFIGRDTILASITKGLDEKCLKPLGIAIRDILPARSAKRFCLIGGPAVAHEMAHHQPTALIVAAQDASAATTVASLLRSDVVKVATSTDPLGVGYCMALKNIYAIPLGMCDGLKYPMNTKAMAFALAIEEMERILVAAGADPRTVAGLAGVGDLLVTGFSPFGRNRTYGEALVGAKTKDPHALGLLTVEGIAATAVGKRLARRLRVKTPLLDAVAKSLSVPHHFERPFVAYLKQLKLQ